MVCSTKHESWSIPYSPDLSASKNAIIYIMELIDTMLHTEAGSAEKQLNDGLHIYVDGSFSSDTQTGGWAFVVYHNEIQIASASGRLRARSNGHTEILGFLRALEWIAISKTGEDVVVWSDSHYVVDGCNRLLKIWRNNRWKRVVANPRERKRSIPDLEEWQAVNRTLADFTSTTIRWCKGHSGRAGNEEADKLASVRLLDGGT